MINYFIKIQKNRYFVKLTRQESAITNLNIFAIKPCNELEYTLVEYDLL